MNRRNFLLASASVGLLRPERILGANDRIRIGFVGCGGRARWLQTYFDNMPGVELAAVADCYFPRTAEAASKRPNGSRWAKYPDYRSMFDREKLDAVFVETTTHARVLIAMHALEAGMDVYAEKPLTLTIAEGRTLVNCVRKHRRILQTGTQQRSMPINRYASRLVSSGAIGKIRIVEVCNFEPPDDWTPKPGEPMPEGLDWNQWCNQTELRPYHRDLQYKWALWRDYDGGGQSWGVSGWGTHALDQVQCALGADDTGPVEMWTEERSPRARVTMKYASGTLLKLEGPKRKHEDLGGIFIGERGRIEIKRGLFTAEPDSLYKGAPESTIEGPGEDLPHLENFFQCMRSRQKPNADVEIGHRSTTVCHLVNICRQLGRKLRWDPAAEQFVDDPEANHLISRPRRKGFELPAV